MRRIGTSLVIVMAATFFLVACGSSTPKPSGADFLASSSTKHNRKKISRGSAFVSPHALDKTYRKVAVMPFRAPVELVGASLSDVFSTELLQTYRYELVERSQMEQVLGEQSLGLKGVTENALAMRVGKMLNVQGIIVGTIPEYGMRAVGSLELPSVGINIRMIDVETGSIVWSVSDSAMAPGPSSLSAFSRHLIESMMYRLQLEWKKAGDTIASNLKQVQVVSYKGALRGAVIEVRGDPTLAFAGYTFLRSRTKRGVFEEVGVVPNNGKGLIRFEDKGLLDAETYYYKVTAQTALGQKPIPTGPFEIVTVGPPSPVGQLRAESGRARNIPLVWSVVNEPEMKGYYILRALKREGPYTEIKFLKGKDKNSFLDKGKGGGGFFGGNRGGLKDFTEYFYKVQTVNIVDVRGPFSPVMSARTKPVPVAVSSVVGRQGEVKQVTLTWSPNPEPDIKEYEIFRGDQPSSITKNIKDVSGSSTQYVDDGLKDGHIYYYLVRAIDSDKLVGGFSEAVQARTKPLPAPPGGLQAEYTGGAISIHWSPNMERDVVRYQLIRKGFFNKKIVETSDTSYSFVDKFEQNEKLSFIIKAVDATGLVSKASSEVTVVIP